MTINVLTLAKLADRDLAAEMREAGAAGLPADIQAALKEQLEQERKANATQAASEILQLYKVSNTTIEQGVMRIRELRREISQIKSSMDRINRAKAYGQTTSNFLPLAVAVNSVAGVMNSRDLRDIDAKLLEVPADFVEPQTTEVQPINE